eukprot:1993390-Prymnesium_polylepis.2
MASLSTVSVPAARAQHTFGSAQSARRHAWNAWLSVPFRLWPVTGGAARDGVFGAAELVPRAMLGRDADGLDCARAACTARLDQSAPSCGA